MIRNTFSILHGIGERLERRLWKSGILTWEDFISAQDIDFINPCKKTFFDEHLSSALRELENANAGYFATIIRRREHWRLFDVFRGEAACLDIETNGFMPGNGGYVTVVGVYDGFDYRCFTRGENLTTENLKKEFSRYKYLITFFGAGFDVPYLMKAMPDLKFDIPHFDICFSSKKLGFRGGLKKLEVLLGIERDEAVRDFDGYDAIKLWEHAKRGSVEALELLKVYNREDTVNLSTIADIVYEKLCLQTGIREYLQHSAACETQSVETLPERRFHRLN
jgi:uncharacterized protein YprB with RNaseH-like and TPR domain